MSFAGIEAGGTRIRCAVAEDGRIVARRELATRNPDATLTEIAEFFDAAQAAHGAVVAAGIATFGPVVLDPRSRRYGEIHGSPKTAWNGVNLRDEIARMLDAPAFIDTDVNAAALAELMVDPMADSLAYVTVGTGVGVGVAGRTVTGGGRQHGEGGHLLVQRHALLRGLRGTCRFHDDCVEGIASGPAIEGLWGAPLNVLPDDHIALDVVADALAQLCLAIHYVSMHDRIVLGGGVIGDTRLLPRVRREFTNRLAGYHLPAVPIEMFIRPTSWPDAGLRGALSLAERHAPS